MMPQFPRSGCKAQLALVRHRRRVSAICHYMSYCMTVAVALERLALKGLALKGLALEGVACMVCIERVCMYARRRIAELIVVSMFGLAITEQYVSPTIVNSYDAFRDLNFLGMTERVFKLAVPVLWGWIIIFYTLFHLLLNITAEFTRFGDREFYLVGIPSFHRYVPVEFVTRHANQV